MSGRSLFFDLGGRKEVKKPGSNTGRPESRLGVFGDLFRRSDKDVPVNSLGCLWPVEGPLCFSSLCPAGWSLRLGLSEKPWRKCQVTGRGTLSGTEPLWGQSLPSLLHPYPAPPWQNHETSLLCTKKGKKKKKNPEGSGEWTFWGSYFSQRCMLKFSLSFINVNTSCLRK